VDEQGKAGAKPQAAGSGNARRCREIAGKTEIGEAMGWHAFLDV
jgi:hypothetical protein